MKKTLLYAVFAVMTCLSQSSFAQQTAVANANTSANVVIPIAISKTADLNFGNLSVGSTNGTVVMSAAGVRSSTGGVTLPATSGSPSVASFTVTGQGSFTYNITLPSSAQTIDDGHSHTMTVDSWASNPSGTGTLTSGSQTLTVGATLHVNAGQTPNSYTSATAFNVTVGYN